MASGQSALCLMHSNLQLYAKICITILIMVDKP